MDSTTSHLSSNVKSQLQSHLNPFNKWTPFSNSHALNYLSQISFNITLTRLLSSNKHHIYTHINAATSLEYLRTSKDHLCFTRLLQFTEPPFQIHMHSTTPFKCHLTSYVECSLNDSFHQMYLTFKITCIQLPLSNILQHRKSKDDQRNENSSFI